MHVMNALCARFNMEGDKVPNPGVLSPAGNRKAQVLAPWKSYGEEFPQSRIHGLSQIFGEMPTAVLNDEILEPGEGQVKVLFNVGGNPMVAWPDQHKTKRSMEALDLLVCIDVKMSATAKLADYILPGKMCLERDDVPVLADTWFNVPLFALCRSDCRTQWRPDRRVGIFLGNRQSHWFAYQGRRSGELPMDEKPSKFDVLELVTAGTKVPLAEIREKDGGHIFDELEFVVEAGEGDAKLQLAPAGIAEEIVEIRSEGLTETGRPSKDGDYTHLLISRRLKHVYNSSGQQYDAIKKKGTTNPAYMNPDDIDELGIKSGDLVQITGPGGSVIGVTKATDDIGRGVCSMTHAWGDLPSNDGSVREIGTSTNRLMTNHIDYDPISGMPRQSSIPVVIRAIVE